MMGVIRTLVQREWSHFIRQPSRVAGSLGQPLLVWIFLGFGLSPSVSSSGLEGGSYLDYLYPGMLVMLVMFSSVFSTITLIEDRQQGFMQGVLVAPVSRAGIVMGKILGGVCVASAQAFILLLLSPLLSVSTGIAGYIAGFLALVLVSFMFTAFGFMLAWRMKTTSAFHAIVMVVLFPLWMLSGALFPAKNVIMWLGGVMKINPVYYAVCLVRDSFAGLFFQNGFWPLLIICCLSGVFFWFALKSVLYPKVMEQ